MKNQHLKQSVLTAGVIAGAAFFGGGWQEAHADTVNNSTAQITTTNPNAATSTTDAQCAVASAQAAVSQAQQKVDSASAAVASASAAVNSATAAQSSAASAASVAQSNYAIASAVAQSQMPSSAEQAAALNGSTIDIKNANLSMFDNPSSDALANVKNQIGEANVTENWHLNPATQRYEMDPSLKDALTVVPTLDDESMTLDPTKLTLAQQSEISNYVAALINQIRAKFGLTAWIYNDMTLAQALAIVNYAYNSQNWNTSVKLQEKIAQNKTAKPDEQEPLIDLDKAHDLDKLFNNVEYQYNGTSDKVKASWENIGIISEKNPNIASTLIKTMGDLKRAATVSIWDMLFNDAHSQNSHARMLLSTNTEYVGVAMDNYGVLHIYGLIPSALQKVNETQTALANANKDVETQKDKLSDAEKKLNKAQDSLNKAQDALEKANLLMAIEAVAKDANQASSSQSTASSTKTSNSKSNKQSSLKDVTVKATSEPTKVSQSKHGDSQLLSTSNAITTAEPSIFERLLPQTGNRNGLGMTILGMLMGMLSFGFLGLRKRRY